MEMTQEEVAKKLGISRSRVFQIEQTALKKLKKKLSFIGFKNVESLHLKKIIKENDRAIKKI